MAKATSAEVSSRLGRWEIVRTLVQGGTTVLLTTQYLDEACGRSVARDVQKGRYWTCEKSPRSCVKRPVGWPGTC